jgi:hypothetical protein
MEGIMRDVCALRLHEIPLCAGIFIKKLIRLLNNHPCLIKKAGIGSYLLICHIPQSQIQNLKLDPCVESLRVEKWLKTYFKD